MGILRLLPPIVEDMTPPDKVKQRNIYEVLVNDADQLLVEGRPMDISELREGAKEFMTNPDNSEDLPEKELVTRAMCQQKVAEYLRRGRFRRQRCQAEAELPEGTGQVGGEAERRGAGG